MDDIKVGDKVVIVDNGGQFTAYTEWANKLSLKGFKRDYEVALESVGEVVAIGKHLGVDVLLCGVKLEDGVDVIMRADCVKKVTLKDILKPWQRVRLACGGMYIVAENVQARAQDRGSLVFVNTKRDFLYLDTATKEGSMWSIVEVFEASSGNGALLDPNTYGKSIWKQKPPETEQEKAVKALKQSIKESQEKLELLEKTL